MLISSSVVYFCIQLLFDRCTTDEDCEVDKCCLFGKLCSPKLPVGATCYLTVRFATAWVGEDPAISETSNVHKS